MFPFFIMKDDTFSENDTKCEMYSKMNYCKANTTINTPLVSRKKTQTYKIQYKKPYRQSD